MTKYVEWLDPIEKKIIDTIIKRAVERGYEMMVNDGEEDATPWTNDPDVVKPEVAATDVTLIYFQKVTTGHRDVKHITRIGAVMLVHGNGEDVIADYHDTDPMTELLGPLGH